MNEEEKKEEPKAPKAPKVTLEGSTKPAEGPLPTVGRIVHYTFHQGPPVAQGGRIEVQAALIVAVHSNKLVNLVMWDSFGGPSSRLSVELHEGDAGTEEAAGKWSWPARV